MALATFQLVVGVLGLLLAFAAFGVFPPLERLVRSSPRGRTVYALLAFFATFLVVSGLRGLG